MNKLQKNISFGIEITWMVVAILSLAAGIHKTYRLSLGDSWMFFLITLIALLMYTWRRSLRKYRNRVAAQNEKSEKDKD